MSGYAFRPVPKLVAAILLLFGLLVLAIGFGGCGSDQGGDDGQSNEAQIRQVAQEFAAAANDQDWEKVYTLFTADAIAQAESFGVTCEQSFADRNPDEQISDISVEGIRIEGDQATAVLRATNSAEGEVESLQVFEKEDGEWKMGPTDASADSP